MNNFQTNPPPRRTAFTGLAAAGFIALIVAGIGLALYSTRFVPTVVNRAGAAVVYIGSILIPNHKPALSVIPASTASTTIFFGTASSTVDTSTNDAITTPSSSSEKSSVIAGEETSGTYQISGTATQVFSGLSDLVVQISVTGYLQSASTDSFTTSSTVPAGSRPAIRFTIKNIGTNVTGPWRFSASIPTQTTYIYQSPSQQSLNPGDSIDYTLGFDQANAGANQTISITANFDHTAAESDTNNNSASATLTILGS